MKTKRRILSILLTVAMVLSMMSAMTITASAATADTTWGTDYDTATEFTIYDIGDLLQFKAMIDAGNDEFEFSGKTVTLDAGFDNENDPLTQPIGMNVGSVFCGTFDGNGRTITLAINNPTNDGQGLFGTIAGTVKNVTVAGSVTGMVEVGGICGRMDLAINNSSILNCTNQATITGNNQVAGICGNTVIYSIIDQCVNQGAIVCSGYMAHAIIGRNGGTSGYATITNCSNTGTITISHYEGDTYTKGPHNLMAYNESAEDGIDVIGYANGGWNQITYENRGIHANYVGTVSGFGPALTITTTPEFVNDGKIVKLTMSIENPRTKEVTINPLFRADTMIMSCDYSLNTVTDNVLKMTEQGVTFFAFSDYENFVVKNTNADEYGFNPTTISCETNRCDSAFVGYFGNTKIPAGETKEFVMYVGVAATDEVDRIVAETLQKPIPSFITTADSGYYADAIDGTTKSGIIAFTSVFSNLAEDFASYTFDEEKDSFGIAMFTSAYPNNVNKSEITTKVSKTNFTELGSKDGYFYSFVKNIDSTHFADYAYGVPFAVIGGKTYWGTIINTSVNGEGTPKWLGPVANMPE